MTKSVMDAERSREIVRALWPKIAVDPSLLDGLLFGEVDDLVGAAVTLSVELGVSRDLPIGLVRRLGATEMSFESRVEVFIEFLRYPAITQMLNEVSS